MMMTRMMMEAKKKKKKKKSKKDDESDDDGGKEKKKKKSKKSKSEDDDDDDDGGKKKKKKKKKKKSDTDASDFDDEEDADRKSKQKKKKKKGSSIDDGDDELGDSKKKKKGKKKKEKNSKSEPDIEMDSFDDEDESGKKSKKKDKKKKNKGKGKGKGKDKDDDDMESSLDTDDTDMDGTETETEEKELAQAKGKKKKKDKDKKKKPKDKDIDMDESEIENSDFEPEPEEFDEQEKERKKKDKKKNKNKNKSKKSKEEDSVMFGNSDTDIDREAESSAGEDMHTDAEKEDTVFGAKKKGIRRRKSFEKKPKPAPTREIDELHDDEGAESDLDGFESETLDALSGAEDNCEDEKPERRMSVGRKALNIVSEKLGFGKKKGKESEAIDNESDSEDLEESWWRSLEENPENSKRSRKKAKTKMRRKKKLAVRPEFAAKVEYVTDEESEYLQDFRRRRSRQKHRGLARPVPSIVSSVPPPVPVPPPPGLYSVAENRIPIHRSPGNVATYMNGQLAKAAEEEKEESELQQAKAISQMNNSSTQQSLQPIHYHYYDRPQPQPQYQLYEDRAALHGGLYPPPLARTPYYYSDGGYYDYDEGSDFDRRRRRKSRRGRSSHKKEKLKRRSKLKKQNKKGKQKEKQKSTSEPKNKRNSIDMKNKSENVAEDTEEVKIESDDNSEVEFVDLSKLKSKKGKSKDQATDEENVMITDRDVQSEKKSRKPMRYESKDSTYNYYSSGDESRVVIQYGEGDKNSRRDRKPRHYHAQRSQAEADSDYESDTELYALRSKLAEIGASKYYPMMVREGITSVEGADMSKLDRLPIKSDKEKSRFLRAFTRLRSNSKNMKTRIYRAFSGSSTSGLESSDDNENDVVGSNKRKGVLIHRNRHSGERSKGRTSPSRHIYVPKVETGRKKPESVRKEKKRRAKSVTFDLAEDDEYSLPSASDDGSEESDSELSLTSDYSDSDSDSD